MNPDAWKYFINNLFVNEDGSRKKPSITLTITDKEGTELVMPNMEVSHNDQLVDIFKQFDAALNAQDHESEKTIKKSKTINVEHIKYKNADYKTFEYVVRRKEDDSFVIQLPTGELIEEGTLTHKGIVKKYKKLFINA